MNPKSYSGAFLERNSFGYPIVIFKGKGTQLTRPQDFGGVFEINPKGKTNYLGPRRQTNGSWTWTEQKVEAHN